MVPNARTQAQLPWTTSAGPNSRFLPTLWVGQTLFLLAGEGSGGLHLTTQSPTLPLCSSLFHPTPRCRRNIRNMSQRRKGPEGPRHQQHNSFPAPVPSLIPRTRAVLLPFPPNTRSSFGSEAPPSSLC